MNDNKLTYLIHAAIWIMVFISPLMFMYHGNGLNLTEFICRSVGSSTLVIVFYANYLWLTPNFFCKNERKYYWTFNAVMIVALAVMLHYWLSSTMRHFDRPPHDMPEPNRFMVLFFIMKNIFNLCITAAIATTIQITMRWQTAETARHEAEAARTEAELKNLRAQLNPHFLLNTLNNIYALIAFNTEKAQEMTLELSKLLRYVLYDNQSLYVNLEKEVSFLTNYINLMKIRLSGDVDVRLTVNIPRPCKKEIAPLLFISLIENAFKHGVSTTKPSFIHIELTADEHTVTCVIKNSCHPKSGDDRSGHGIGLQQVARRLELLYHGKYEWHKGTDKDNTIYSSTIKIYDTEMCNH